MCILCLEIWWNPLVHALRVRLVIVTTRWLLCLRCVNFRINCLKVKLHRLDWVFYADQNPEEACSSRLQTWHRKGRGETIVPQPVMDIIVKIKRN